MPRAPESTDDPSTDGRVQRGARNRERIVDAMLELVRSGALRPTAERVADRAGVGTRTVFRHFDDMDALYAEMDAVIRNEAVGLVKRLDPSASLTDRIDRIVEIRAAVFEHVAPFKRAAALQLWRSEFLQEGHDQMNRVQRAELLRTLPELAALPEPLQDAADLIASFEGWNRLRSDQRLGRERTAETMRSALRALLGVR